MTDIGSKHSTTKRINLPLYNLRGVSILFVLAFHSLLAYVAFLPKGPYILDRAPYLWRAFPIVDKARWFGFDLFCAWLNIYLMTFFFFLSGFFVWSSLRRKGRYRFLLDRFIRLAVPFALAVGVLMPLANYPTYLQTASTPDFAVYWHEWLSLPFWPCGPMWFIWLLLAFDILVVAVDIIVPKWDQWLIRLSSTAQTKPIRYLAGFILASALAYVPMALAFTPSKWISFGPLSFEPSHLLHYIVYFFAGIGIGAYGIDRGLFAPDGWLLRNCTLLVLAAVSLWLLWMGANAPMALHPGLSSPVLEIVASFVFVLACASNCLALLAVGFKYARRPLPVLDGLSENAYNIYLVHYPFVIWLQFLLLTVSLPAVVKGPIVFAGTLLLSWWAVVGLRHAAGMILPMRSPTASRSFEGDPSHSDRRAF
ncbi:MAG TPA: acyltransferase [Methylovirgula sp.]|nr:acyltransferase [Methylovirgula sp.]